MKNTLKFLALAAAVAAFASCNEKVEVPVAKTDVAPLSISAGTESKTILRNDSEVRWISLDSLFVFDNDYSCYSFRNSSSSEAAQTTFLYDAWPTDKTPVFALNSYSNGKTTIPSFDGDKATAILYASQAIYNKKSYARYTGLSVGEIAYDGEQYSVEEMKNCFSLIQFKVKNSDIYSIELSGTNNEQLAGWVDVDYSKINPIGEDDHNDPFWTGSDGKTKSKTIKVTVSSNGGNTDEATGKKVFDNTDCWYYIALLPQVVSGLSFKVTKADGTVETQEITGPITLNRSKIRKLAHPVDSALFQPSSYIELDCTDAAKFKRQDGDDVTSLPMRSDKPTTAFDFWLEGYEDYIFNGKAYQWNSSQHYLCVASGDPIQLPNIEGYTLSEMSVTAQYSSQTPNYRLTDGTTVLTSASINKSTSTFPVTLDISAYPQTSSSPNRYLTVAGEGNIKFTLKYVPVSE